MDVIDFLASHMLALFFCALLIGLLVGSFLNVLIYRLPKMMLLDWHKQACEILNLPTKPQTETFNLVLPNSNCPHCSHEIKSWENIPVISYLFLQGKCSSCKAPISMRYPLVELACGLLSAFIAWHFGFTWQAGAMLWLGLITNSFGLFASLEDALWGAIAGYLSLWSVYWLFKLVTGKEGMGYGDFKLLAMLGAWGGWQVLPLTILLSSLVGAVLGLIMLRLRNAETSTPIPFGPYLAIAGWIALLWGEQITSSYLQIAGF